MTTRDPEHTGITINGKFFGNPEHDLLWNIRAGIRQMTEDGDEMRISGLVALTNGWLFTGMGKLISGEIDIPFAHTHGRSNYADFYFIKRTGL